MIHQLDWRNVDNTTIPGIELWNSDDAAAVTVRVRDIKANPGLGFNLRELVNVNNTLYFAANDVAIGIELWKSHGTEAGTIQVRDKALAVAISYSDQLINIDGLLYFKPLAVS